MTRSERMKKLLKTAFDPCVLEITDESQLHAGHAGHDGRTESHFAIKIISNAFSNKKLVQKHRMVNEVLKNEFISGLHALKISASDKK